MFTLRRAKAPKSPHVCFRSTKQCRHLNSSAHSLEVNSVFFEGVRFIHEVKLSVDRWLCWTSKGFQRSYFLFDKIPSELSLSATIRKSVSSLFLQLSALLFGVYTPCQTHTNLLPAELLSAGCRLLFQRRETRDVCVKCARVACCKHLASSVFAYWNIHLFS